MFLEQLCQRPANGSVILHKLPIVAGQAKEAAQLFCIDRIFNSLFWRQLFAATGTNLKMSSSYHLQTNGQTERVNQCLEGYLRCFAHACPTKWLPNGFSGFPLRSIGTIRVSTLLWALLHLRSCMAGLLDRLALQLIVLAPFPTCNLGGYRNASLCKISCASTWSECAFA
jgi:hypothetical protein